MELPLYGGVRPFSVHICCATGRDDWAHTIEDVKGSIAQQVAGALKTHEVLLSTKDRVVLSNISVDPKPLSKDYSGIE